MLSEFTVTKSAKKRALFICAKNEDCKTYVNAMEESKEAYVTFEGINTIRKMVKLNPKPSPSCALLLMAYISAEEQNGYESFCD